MEVNGENGRSVFSAAIPPKLDQIWKYLARINFKAFITGENHGEPTHPPS